MGSSFLGGLPLDLLLPLGCGANLGSTGSMFIGSSFSSVLTSSLIASFLSSFLTFSFLVFAFIFLLMLAEGMLLVIIVVGSVGSVCVSIGVALAGSVFVAISDDPGCITSVSLVLILTKCVLVFSLVLSLRSLLCMLACSMPCATCSSSECMCLSSCPMSYHSVVLCFAGSAALTFAMPVLLSIAICLSVVSLRCSLIVASSWSCIDSKKLTPSS